MGYNRSLVIGIITKGMIMNNKIVIQVCAYAGSGKSAVAELLRQALTIVGFEVTLNDDNGIGHVDEAPGVIAESLHSRIESIKTLGTPIEIRTTQMRRDGSYV